MVYPSAYGSSNKPSWAFDVTDRLQRSSGSSQSYRVPYPRPPAEKEDYKEPFLCARIFLMLINVLFFIIGFAMVITSIVAAGKPDSCQFCYSILRPLLISGIITTFISIMGVFGAACNSYRLLLVYVTCVAFLLMVQMIVFFWSLFGRANFKRRMHSFFTAKIRYHPYDLVGFLDEIQAKYTCCGVDGPHDYHAAGIQLPPSCCHSSAGFQCGRLSGPAGATPAIIATVATNASAAENVTAAVNASLAVTPASSELGRPTVALHALTKGARHRLQNVTGSGMGNVTANSTNALLANITTMAPLSELFNRTNLSGGPETWDIRHVKMRGCYHVLWASVEGHYALVVEITVGLALFLTLQLMILCMAHRVARGGFIEEA
ncbi:uncharacterized protein LOC119103465 [Pollicipes pollicipes]|uniref:uncharacterized protein LOC119103465 n=1 Tax=Pollicipes pollicipes TaxID=41117 RepID=UPI0018858237|nr:uncharacterized protein LOC119103465 [Pollicipes pollicipes]